MELPVEAEVKDCYTHFIQATSNESLATKVCAVCAQETGAKDGSFIRLDEFPRICDILIPRVPNEKHQLWNGMLLYLPSLRAVQGINEGWLCNLCRRRLASDLLPKYALANNLWIGDVPYELAVLTIPEQLLIARHYPRCYVFKLYPKAANARMDQDHLQRAMVGNVSLYEHNMGAIVEMLTGQLMPQNCAVLASVLAITFVAAKKLPLNWLKSTFRVRRRVVFEALVWLKCYNVLYQDIQISEDRLSQIPEDGVPVEIASVVRHEEKEDFAIREQDGYVPDVVAAGPGICLRRDDT
jgi:hypothetical protein